MVLILTADCEEGNKQAFEAIKTDIENETIAYNFLLLSVLPDAPHVGKSLKCSFSNWFLKLGDERGNLSVIRNLRNRSSPDIQKMMRILIPINDHVRNRDRQDPQSVVTLTNEKLCDYLMTLKTFSSTIMPETCRYTTDNRSGMYKKPIAIAIGPYGWFYVLYDFDASSGTTSLLKARLHSPIEVTQIKQNICANELHFASGVLFMCGDSTPITFYDEGDNVQYNFSKAMTKKKALEKCAMLGIKNTNNKILNQLKAMLQAYQTKVKNDYESKGLSRDQINVCERDDVIFTAFSCTEDENLILAASSSLQSILSMSLKFDGYGITADILAQIPYKSTWSGIKSMCLYENQIFAIVNDGIYSVSLESHSSTLVVGNEDIDPFQVRSTDTSVIISDPKTRKLYAYYPSTGVIDVFAGTGDEMSIDGPTFACSFKQPCGIAVEFGSVVYVTDVMAASVCLITNIEKTVEFLRAVGTLYKAFSIHGKGKKYNTYPLTEASQLIKHCADFLEDNEKQIRSSVTSKLPSALMGPHGSVASKTIKSVGLIQWAVDRLMRITSEYNYNEASLLSCMTLDVEHLHATTHFKNPVMSMLEYSRSFGTSVKESIKRLSDWGVYYFTKDTSWYPLPENSIKFTDMHTMKPLPPVELSADKVTQLKDFSGTYGRCVRQLSNRQTTTKAKAGTLPHTCYDNNHVGERVALTVTDDVSVDTPMQLEEDVEVNEDTDLEEPSVTGEDEYSDDDCSDQGDGADFGADFGVEVTRETTFLIGHTSRFGRATRFNSKAF